MHILKARLFKHRKIDRCNKATEMQLRQIYVDMEERCGEVEFKLYWGNRGKMFE